MISDAIISQDGYYRYALQRVWDEALPIMIWVMLNPSTADGTVDDPTIRKCMKFARTLGYGGIMVFNLTPYRSVDPKRIYGVNEEDHVMELNYEYVHDTLRSLPPGQRIVHCAWGQHGVCRDLAYKFVSRLHYHDDLDGLTLKAFRLTKTGQPWHPLYLTDDTVPFVWGGPV